MATRGAIGFQTADGVPLVYHHWDSYPDALGKTLWDLYHGHFAGNLSAMRDVLMAHSWSSINRSDFSLAPGYDSDPAPACYCHGARSEPSRQFPLSVASGSGCEYVYVFDSEAKVLSVLLSYHDDGTKAIGMFGHGDPNAEWRVLARVELDGPEPKWETLS